MKELTFASLSILVMILLLSCASLNEAKDSPYYPDDTAIAWFPKNRHCAPFDLSER